MDIKNLKKQIIEKKEELERIESKKEKLGKRIDGLPDINQLTKRNDELKDSLDKLLPKTDFTNKEKLEKKNNDALTEEAVTNVEEEVETYKSNFEQAKTEQEDIGFISRAQSRFKKKVAVGLVALAIAGTSLYPHFNKVYNPYPGDHITHITTALEEDRIKTPDYIKDVEASVTGLEGFVKANAKFAGIDPESIEINKEGLEIISKQTYENKRQLDAINKKLEPLYIAVETVTGSKPSSIGGTVSQLEEIANNKEITLNEQQQFNLKILKLYESLDLLTGTRPNSPEEAIELVNEIKVRQYSMIQKIKETNSFIKELAQNESGREFESEVEARAYLKDKYFTEPEPEEIEESEEIEEPELDSIIETDLAILAKEKVTSDLREIYMTIYNRVFHFQRGSIDDRDIISEGENLESIEDKITRILVKKIHTPDGIEIDEIAKKYLKGIYLVTYPDDVSPRRSILSIKDLSNEWLEKIDKIDQEYKLHRDATLKLAEIINEVVWEDSIFVAMFPEDMERIRGIGNYSGIADVLMAFEPYTLDKPYDPENTERHKDSVSVGLALHKLNVLKIYENASRCKNSFNNDDDGVSYSDEERGVEDYNMLFPRISQGQGWRNSDTEAKLNKLISELVKKVQKEMPEMCQRNDPYTDDAGGLFAILLSSEGYIAGKQRKILKEIISKDNRLEIELFKADLNPLYIFNEKEVLLEYSRRFGPVHLSYDIDDDTPGFLTRYVNPSTADAFSLLQTNLNSELYDQIKEEYDWLSRDPEEIGRREIGLGKIIEIPWAFAFEGHMVYIWQDGNIMIDDELHKGENQITQVYLNTRENFTTPGKTKFEDLRFPDIYIDYLSGLVKDETINEYLEAQTIPVLDLTDERTIPAESVNEKSLSWTGDLELISGITNLEFRDAPQLLQQFQQTANKKLKFKPARIGLFYGPEYTRIENWENGKKVKAKLSLKIGIEGFLNSENLMGVKGSERDGRIQYWPVTGKLEYSNELGFFLNYQPRYMYIHLSDSNTKGVLQGVAHNGSIGFRFESENNKYQTVIELMYGRGNLDELIDTGAGFQKTSEKRFFDIQGAQIGVRIPF